jgi:hypothetical protein
MRGTERGFSILELIVGQGIGFAVILIALFVLLMTQSGAMHVLASSEATEDIQDIRRSLSVDGQCTLNLAGIAFDINNRNGASVPVLSWFDSSGKKVQDLLTVGHVRNGIKTSDIRLRALARTGQVFYSGSLDIYFTREADGKNLPPQSVLLYVQSLKGAVKNCWVRQSPETKTADNFCALDSQGLYNQWDPKSNQCVLANGIWSGNNPFTARCPAGTVLPDLPSEQGCQVITPSSWVDTFPTQTITLSDGSTTTIGRAPWLISYSNGTCTCTYATDLSKATVATFQCQIQCIQL